MNLLTNQISCVIAQAYVFHELYKRDFIKSKSFQYAFDSMGLQNKLMHILKSAVNNKIESANLGQYFGEPTFARESLKISHNIVSGGGRGVIFNHIMSELVSAANTGLGGVMQLNAYGSGLTYRFDNIYSRVNIGDSYYGYGHTQQGPDKNMKQDLDDLINTIMYVPASIELIGNAVSYCNNLNLRERFTVFDAYHLVEGLWQASPERSRLRVEFTNLRENGKLDQMMEREIVLPEELKECPALVNDYNVSKPMLVEITRIVTELGKEYGSPSA